MNEHTLKKWLEKERGLLYPPGTETGFVESPKLKNIMACTIGLVHSHRFAFYFWSKFNEKYSKNSLSLTHDMPVLVTIDFHDDSGVESDFDKEEIKEIDISDDVELGLYCWLRLRALNDGHILPALI